ncbi:MAG: hypothetical protein K5840_08310 [Eubacterium sp.]|nr:hypothetical protein [Eubacterium sp.]
MTKKSYMIAMIAMVCLIAGVCLLGYFGVIQNGVIISGIVIALEVCILATGAVYLFRNKSFDKVTFVSMVAAVACAFIIITH